MQIAFVVRDELVPVRNGYHSTGTNLLRQLAMKAPVRCVHLAATPVKRGATAEWCADHGMGYVVVGLPQVTSAEGSSGLGVLRTLARALRPSVRHAVAHALRAIHLGQGDERIVMFTTGWDALGDIAATFGTGAICLPADSITLFEKRRRLAGIRRLLRPGRVALAATRERAMLTAGFSRVVYVTESDAEQARSLLNSASAKRVVTMPIGINPEDFSTATTMQERLAKHGEVLIFSGTLAYLPNRDAAVRLASQIAPGLRHASARVRIVGHGGEALAGLAGPRVEIAGWAPSLIDELQRATLFVAPVRMGAGAKNNILQSLAAGTPVVGTLSCFAGFDALPPGAIVCHSDDEFVRAIELLLGDRPRLAALSEEARAYVLQNCTWGNSASRLHSYLRQVA